LKNKRTSRRDKSATRESILAAARQLISRDGPEAMSIVRVAKMAGVNRGTAYQHFPDRESLVEAAVRSVGDMLTEAVFPAGETGPLWDNDNLVRLANSMAMFMADNAALCRVWLFDILSSDNPSGDPFGARYLKEVARSTSREICQPGIDSEVFAIIALMGYLIWPIWNHAEKRSAAERRALAARFVAEMLRLCLYGITRPEAYPHPRSAIAGKFATHEPVKQVRKVGREKTAA
jgi:AcrR family transcriptional regulator